MEEIVALRPFVPAKDFAVSKAFYLALGFSITLDDAEIAILKYGSFSFILQNFYVPALADNFMLQLMVRNVTPWWARIEASDVVKKFGIKTAKPPAMQPWGMRVAFLSDPSGVLWHIAESLF